MSTISKWSQYNVIVKLLNCATFIFAIMQNMSTVLQLWKTARYDMEVQIQAICIIFFDMSLINVSKMGPTSKCILGALFIAYL